MGVESWYFRAINFLNPENHKPPQNTKVAKSQRPKVAKSQSREVPEIQQLPCREVPKSNKIKTGSPEVQKKLLNLGRAGRRVDSVYFAVVGKPGDVP